MARHGALQMFSFPSSLSRERSGDAGRKPGVIGVTDADAGNIGEQIFHRALPAARR
jgi:hypothetical protein